ncbi:MAG: hypothetical protein LUQ50_14605 [Methanospirillum sp.]|nr:hypothetical protein [Methanospirillum sp.]MDD1730284.1 hypothetical protein [Methanospirillum sp.]
MNVVTAIEKELIDAYELRTGFKGIGEFFAQEGLLQIIGGEPCQER